MSNDEQVEAYAALLNRCKRVVAEWRRPKKPFVQPQEVEDALLRLAKMVEGPIPSIDAALEAAAAVSLATHGPDKRNAQPRDMAMQLAGLDGSIARLAAARMSIGRRIA